MNPRLKQALLILAFLAATGAFGYALYYFFFRATLPTEEVVVSPTSTISSLPRAPRGTATPTTSTTGTGSLPSTPSIPTPLSLPPTVTPEQAPRTLTVNENVSNSLSNSPNGARFYDAIQGKFYRVNDDGTTKLLSDQTFFNVDQVYWGKSSDQAIITYPDGTKTYYNFKENRQVTLPSHWDSFDFAPADDKLITKSIGNNENNRFLVVSNPDGTNAHAIEELGTNQDKVTVSWSPNNQIVAFADTAEGIGFDRQQIVLVGQNRENFKNLIVEGRGFVPNWSPSGNMLLYSVYNSSDDYKPSLWVSGAVGDQVNANRRNLNLQTWADKCVWQNESVIICAVPKSLETGAGLQRDIANDTEDNIYRINLANASITNLGSPEGNHNINQMVVTKDGSAVLFTDRVTGKLIRFAL
jgi:hypothetical protein